jgi:hypothetical protein
MAEILSGDAALAAMNDDGQGGGNDKDFSKFNVGTKYTVKVLGTNDFFAFYSYGIFRKGGGGVHSFIAKNPSKKSAKGYPVENLTPWDKAWKHHADQSEEFGDHHSQEAYKYKPELRYALGFFDLDSGQRIVIDVSKKQAKTLRDAIVEFADDLGETAFKVSKATGGAVALTPVLSTKKLTDEQRENFDNAPSEFKIEDFHGILFEMEDAEQIEKLVGQGFDVSQIGLEAPKQGDKPAEDNTQNEDPTAQF